MAACDPLRERLEVARSLHAGARCFPEFAEVPAAFPLDAVLIATPPGTHPTLTRQALARRLPALVEKPLAPEAEAARTIAREAQAAGTFVQVGFNRRFRSNYRELRGRISELGPDGLESLECEIFTRRDRWAPEADFEEPLGAGVHLLHDLGSHQADLLPWLAGRPVHEVWATVAVAGEREPTVAWEARLAGGLRAHCSVGFARRSRERLWTVVRGRRTLLASPGGLREARGWRRGTLGAAARVADIVHLGWSRLRGRPSMTGESFERQLDAFADGVLGRPHPDAALAADGVRSSLAVEACIRSLRTGRAIRLGLTEPGRPAGR